MAKLGDYVLATKYSDGDSGDQWCVGTLERVLDEYDPPRFQVVDGDGNPFRHNGFRRVRGASRRMGERFVKNIPNIEASRSSIWALHRMTWAQREEWERCVTGTR